MRKLLWCALILVVFILGATAHKIDVDVFDINTREQHLFVFGTVTLEEGETIGANDEIYFILEAKDGPVPQLSKVDFILLDSIEGTTLVQQQFPMESNTLKPTKMKWVDEASEDTREFFFSAMFTIHGDISPSVSRARIEYNRQDDKERYPYHAVFDVAVYAPIAEIMSFNATCLDNECMESPYVISVQDLHTDIREVSFTVRGASRLEISESTLDRIDCFVNNNKVIAYLDGFKGRGIYTITHRMYKGLDYTIRCPESVLVNRYDGHDSSVASMAVITADNAKHTQNTFFSLQYDALFAQVYSSTETIAKTDNHAFYTRFPIAFEPGVKHPAKFNAQVEFTDIHPSEVEVIGLDKKTNEVIFYHVVIPEKDIYPFFDIDLKGYEELNIIIVGTVDKSTVYSTSLVQSRLELQYKAPAMEGRKQIDVIVVGIGDIPVVTPLKVHPVLELVKLQDEQKDKPFAPFEFTIDNLQTDEYFSDLHLAIPTREIEITLDPKTADPKNISCTLGELTLKAPYTVDDHGRVQPIVFKSVKLGNIKKEVFKCDDTYFTFPKQSTLHNNIMHVEVVSGDLTKFDIHAQNIIVKGVEEKKKGKDYDFIKYVIVAVLGFIIVATATFIIIRRIRKPNTDNVLLGDDEYHQIQ